MRQMEISGLTVLDQDGRRLGFVTRRDLQLADGDSLVSECMTSMERLVVAPPDISDEQARATLFENRLEGN
mgnify:CR=1 FL=1